MHNKKILALIISLVLIISQCGCMGKRQEAVSSGEDWLLNTYCTITIEESGKEELISGAFALARELEDKLSRTIESSDIGRLNASENGCEVSPETAELVRLGAEYGLLTGGKFDITVGSVSSLWDFTAEQPSVPEASEIENGVKFTQNYDKLEVFEINASGAGLPTSGAGVYYIGKPEGVKVDLGGIAKGYIADKAAEYLRANGAKRGIVNFGGNIVIIGSKEDGSLWNIGIEKPFSGQKDELLENRDVAGCISVAGDMSVVTSGTYERCFSIGDVLYHHVLDPLTGYPAETDLISVSVTGPSSARCDALSTGCLIAGSEKALELIESQEGYEAVFIAADGSVTTSSGAVFEEYK